MKISRELAIQILKYCHEHKDFYFPFLVVCKKYTPEDDDFVEIESEEWETILRDKTYETFELWENLQDLREGTVEHLTNGFIQIIIGQSLEKHIYTLAKNYRRQWQNGLCESEKIEKYGLNEFIGGKADAYEDCLYLIKKYQGISSNQNSIFIKYEDE